MNCQIALLMLAHFRWICVAELCLKPARDREGTSALHQHHKKTFFKRVSSVLDTSSWDVNQWTEVMDFIWVICNDKADSCNFKVFDEQCGQRHYDMNGRNHNTQYGAYML